MKISFIFVLIICTFSSVFATRIPNEEIRMLFNQATSSEKSCIKLITICSSPSTLSDITVLGYKACATILMAKYVNNPFVKWSKFSTGKNLLEKAVKADPSNIELRYLRYSIQTNLPSFLGYNNNINSDKLFLLKEIKTMKDEQLKILIVNYLARLDYTTIEK